MMWIDRVVVDGVIFKVRHLGWHPMGQMLVTASCECGATVEIECSACGARAGERVLHHHGTQQAHAEALLG